MYPHIEPPEDRAATAFALEVERADGELAAAIDRHFEGLVFTCSEIDTVNDELHYQFRLSIPAAGHEHARRLLSSLEDVAARLVAACQCAQMDLPQR